MSEDFDHLRLIEAMLFASAQPVPQSLLASRLPPDTDVAAILRQLQQHYAPRGINLVQREESWAFRTAADLAGSLVVEQTRERRLSRAAMEVLAIIAYHQPVTRAEIEEVRGVALSRGTLDLLLEAGWIRPKGRRRTPGRPLQWATSEGFLDHFGLESLEDLPNLKELKSAGLLDARPAADAYGNRAVEGDDPVDTLEPDEPLLEFPEDDDLLGLTGEC